MTERLPAAEAMKPYVDMQIMGAHPTEQGFILELGFIGRPRSVHRFVSITGYGYDDAIDCAGVVVTEAVDPPAPRHRNRRGYTDAPTLAQHHIDQGDERAERDREQTDWCDL